MKTYIVTRAFQFRGTMFRAGQSLKLDDNEAKDPFVAAHVKPADPNDEGKPAPAPYLGNGTTKQQEETPAAAANGAEGDMTAKEMRAALAKMGVPCPPNATKEDLSVLLAQAKEAVAGSAEEANKPKATGK